VRINSRSPSSAGECLLDAADQFEQAIYSGTLAQLPPLNDVLVEGLG
jgi:hypothetical protein